MLIFLGGSGLPKARTAPVDGGIETSAAPVSVKRRVSAASASLREHSLIIAVTLLYLLAGEATPWLLGRPELHFTVKIGEMEAVAWFVGFVCILAAGSVGAVLAAIRRYDDGPFRAAGSWMRVVFLRLDRVWGGVIVLLLFPIFAWNFAFLKALLPLLHKFDWDPMLAAWDRAVHFGRQPWEWLQPLLGFPRVSSLLSDLYGAWFAVFYCVMVWQAFSRRDPVLRMQYLLTVMAVWIVLGNIAATLLASAGPVYYGRITGLPDPFAPLMAYLNAASLQWHDSAMKIQEVLWSLYLVNGRNGEINGSISSMPSLHVANACCWYLVARGTSVKLGRVFLVLLLIILIGSVHLGWHYAIDGYAGILGTLIIWWACGSLLRLPGIRRWLWGRAVAAGEKPGAAIPALAAPVE